MLNERLMNCSAVIGLSVSTDATERLMLVNFFKNPLPYQCGLFNVPGLGNVLNHISLLRRKP
jgi:hypothetical protein